MEPLLTNPSIQQFIIWTDHYLHCLRMRQLGEQRGCEPGETDEVFAERMRCTRLRICEANIVFQKAMKTLPGQLEKNGFDTTDLFGLANCLTCPLAEKAELADELWTKLKPKMQRLTIQTGAEKTVDVPEANKWPAESDKASFLAYSDIASNAGVRPDPLRKRLDRWRGENPAEGGRGWQEVTDARPRQPRHLYRVGAVLHLIFAE